MDTPVQWIHYSTKSIYFRGVTILDGKLPKERVEEALPYIPGVSIQ